MKTLLTLLFAFITVSFLTIPAAEAKRLGGGASLGKQTTMPRQAQAPAAALPQTQRPATAAPAAGGASRWFHPWLAWPPGDSSPRCSSAGPSRA